jgi:hypothetical protein
MLSSSAVIQTSRWACGDQANIDQVGPGDDSDRDSIRAHDDEAGNAWAALGHLPATIATTYRLSADQREPYGSVESPIV